MKSSFSGGLFVGRRLYIALGVLSGHALISTRSKQTQLQHCCTPKKGWRGSASDCQHVYGIVINCEADNTGQET